VYVTSALNEYVRPGHRVLESRVRESRLTDADSSIGDVRAALEQAILLLRPGANGVVPLAESELHVLLQI
jgi:hypothetical protein